MTQSIRLCTGKNLPRKKKKQRNKKRAKISQKDMKQTAEHHLSSKKQAKLDTSLIIIKSQYFFARNNFSWKITKESS